MDQLIEQFFNIDVMIKALPLMLRGLAMTLLLCLIVIPVGLAGGLAVAITTTRAPRPIRIAVNMLVDLFRAIPPLVLLLFVYSALPFAGVKLSPLAAVVIASQL